MTVLRKYIATLVVCLMTLNSVSAFAGCEPEELQAQQDIASKARGDVPDGMSSDDGKAKSQEEEDKKGLFGLVMDCGMLFLTAGMSPDGIKNAACDMKCFTKIRKACDFKFTPKGGIEWKQGGEANVICPPIFPLVMAFK